MTRKQAGKILKIVEGLEHKNGSEYYRFGFDYFGPFLYGYTKWLYETTSAKGIDNILFFARDGYMMQKAYDRLPGGVKTQYVYFSRKSLRQALLCHAEDYRDSLKYYSWKRFVSVAEILDFYGFDSDERNEIASENNLELTREYVYEELPQINEIADLYAVLKDEIDRRSRIQSELLLRYIGQIGLNDGSAIVDIGWHGNMQYYLEEFLKINGIKIRLKGFYVGINADKKQSGELYGYLYSDDDLSLRKSTLCFFGIYEKLFQSLEGSTLGYYVKDGHIEALKAVYEYAGDKTMGDAVCDMQNGALACFDELCAKEYTDFDLKSFAMPLINYGQRPTLEQTLLFKNMYNTDGIKTYFLPQKKLSQYRLKELKRELSNSSWKTGFMKAAFKVPFPYDWIYKVMRK